MSEKKTKKVNDFFMYKNDILCVEDVSIINITNNIKTPFYVYSTASLRRRYTDLATSLKNIKHSLYRRDYIIIIMQQFLVTFNYIICVINYNSSPIIKSSGSAIFLHVAKEDYSSTEGCIALKKEDLMEVINKITYETRITIKD